MKFCMECGQRTVLATVEGKERSRCPSCGWVLWEDPKVAVAVIVAQGDTVLLGRRGGGLGRGRWSFPAGFVDRGEKLEEAGAREVREETGLRVALGSLFALRSETGDPVVLAVYPAQVVGGALTPGEEMTELRWFGREEIPEMAFGHDAELLANWWESRGADECAR